MASYVRNSALGREYLGELTRGRDASTRDIATQLHDLAPQAVETMQAALRGELGGSAVDHLRFKAAESILDRVGYARTLKQAVAVQNYASIEHIQRLAAEMQAGQEQNQNVRAAARELFGKAQ